MVDEGRTAPDEKVIDVLRKLLAKERSTRELGNVEEAEVFAAGIQRLLLKHKIEMADVTVVELDRTDPFGVTVFWEQPGRSGRGSKVRGRRIEWLERLADVVSRANFCRILVHHKGSQITFVGRGGDRDVVVYLYDFLARAIETHCDREYHRIKHNNTNHGISNDYMRGWREAFRAGAIDSIARRFAEQRAATDAEQAKYALVLVGHDKAVAQYVAERWSGHASAVRQADDSNRHGYQAGREFGDKVEIRANAVREGGKAAGAIR